VYAIKKRTKFLEFSALVRLPVRLLMRLLVRLGELSKNYFLPQHSSAPTFTSLLSTPLMPLAAISVTPVSV
jgi:hypothetical protein